MVLSTSSEKSSLNVVVFSLKEKKNQINEQF